MAGRVLRDEELAFVSGQLAALTAREAPLGSGLRAMAADAPSGPLREALSRLADDVERGVLLSKAVQAQPVAFPELLAAAVEAGEASNSLPDVLSMLSRNSRMVANLRARAWQAAIYPASILVLSTGFALFALKFFLPSLVQVPKELGVELPGFLVSLDWLGAHLGGLLTVSGLVGVATALAVFATRTQPPLQATWERLVLWTPLVGRFVRSAVQARFCRMLGLLLKAGVPVSRALRLAARSGASKMLERAEESLGGQAERGCSLSLALAPVSLCSGTLWWMVEMAEKRGDLPDALLDMADHYEQESEHAAGLMNALLPAVFVVALLPVLWLVVGLVLLPLISLMASIGSG